MWTDHPNPAEVLRVQGTKKRDQGIKQVKEVPQELEEIVFAPLGMQ